MNLSGSLIGINGLMLILIILLISPFISWYMLYNQINSSKEFYYTCGYEFMNYKTTIFEFVIGLNVNSILGCILLMNVSSMILHYIMKYLYRDKSILIFLGTIMLFSFLMILLIISNDSLLVFFGWEMIGLISLLLINTYKNRIESTKAGLKSLVYNRLGDITLLWFVIISFNLFSHNNLRITMLCFNSNYYAVYVSLLLGFCLIISCGCKSTQLGFQPWLLDAMEGPTPVSAFLHSATLVTSGIILFYKHMYLIISNNSIAICFLLLGGISCFLNSLSSINSLDVKRIIAYSTCTHISLIIMILGINSDIGFIHFFHHGWSKSLLFMTLGSLIAMKNTQDLRPFGNLYSHLPIFYVLFNLSLLSLLGCPGSYFSHSKDLIISLGCSSLVGSNFNFFFIVIVLLSQGYNLGCCYYVMYNTSYSKNNCNLSNVMFLAMNNRNNIIFLSLIFFVLYGPFLCFDLAYTESIHLMHHSSSFFDPFSLIALLGLFLSYIHDLYGHRIYFFNLHSHRFYIDKFFSYFFTILSLHIIDILHHILEYGYLMNSLHFVNLVFLCSFVV
jgi:NADH:ubiquinone oxidoreductase subunit 5 (subunit L)/multisubunit Na+/H+ antiporter MnhA subunit